MNTNLFRTILNALTGGTLTSILTTIAGCTGDNPLTPVVEAPVCSAAWIPLEYQAIAGLVFVAIGFLLKMFGGPAGATAAQKLAAPVVPIVPEKESGPGTVTIKQVEEDPPKNEKK